MQTVQFSFNGEHTMVIPDGDLAMDCLADVIHGHSYPFPLQMEPKVVVDIGAHVGEFTIMAALIWPNATIHAFEPFPDAVVVMRENLRQFSNVVIHQKAVSGAGGRSVFHLSGFGTICHSLNVEQMPSPTGETVEVECVGARDIAALKPDVLKMDCEGAERGIIDGLWLSDIERIERIQLEYHREQDRIHICRLLDETHALDYARVHRQGQGELTYVRKG